MSATYLRRHYPSARPDGGVTIRPIEDCTDLDLLNFVRELLTDSREREFHADALIEYVIGRRRDRLDLPTGEATK